MSNAKTNQKKGQGACRRAPESNFRREGRGWEESSALDPPTPPTTTMLLLLLLLLLLLEKGAQRNQPSLGQRLARAWFYVQVRRHSIGGYKEERKRKQDV